MTFRRETVPMPEDPFLAVVRCPSGSIDAFEAALALVLDARPEADLATLRGTVAAWAEDLSRRIERAGATGEPLTGALLLARLLFVELDFRGDADTPHDPANSEMDAVLDRRRGLPLTLGLLMAEVGRRAGLPLHCTSYPGRLLVALAVAPRPMLFDPFAGGRLVLPEECQGLVDRARAGRRLHEAFAAPCPPRRLVQRLLDNLKHAHVRRGDLAAAIRAQGRLVDLKPGDPAPLQERAWLAFQAGRHDQAVADLEDAARVADEGTRGEVRRQLEQVRRWASAVGPRAGAG